MLSAKHDLGEILEQMLRISEEAASLIRNIYTTDFKVEYKKEDDPVTNADKEANELICRELTKTYPGVPIVAEESSPATYEGYQASSSVFFVDPIDGTREFVARQGEFAVMIGLAEQGHAVLGVVNCPALGFTYLGGEGLGAFRLMNGVRAPIHVSQATSLEGATALISRSHRSRSLEALLSEKRLSMKPCGSMGIKGGKIAEAEGDVYVQPGIAGNRWDACAPEAIVHAAGGLVTDMRGEKIDYASGELRNTRGFVATNTHLHSLVIECVATLTNRTSS